MLSACGIKSLEQLTENEISDEQIKQFRENGLIVSKDDPNAEVAFVRRAKGLGTSDDAAFIFTGSLYLPTGNTTAKSAFLAGVGIDGVDTYEKYLSNPIEGGHDEYIGRMVYDVGLVSDNDIMTVIYLSAKANAIKTVFMSSSHRRLIQKILHVHPRIPTAMHHLRFMLENTYQKNIKFGFDKVSSENFYSEVSERMKSLKY